MANNVFSDEEVVEKIPLHPLWTVKDWKSKEGKARWFKDTFPGLQRRSEDRIRDMKNNLAWYMGEYNELLEYQVRMPGSNRVVPLPRKLVHKAINHLWRITEERVAHMARFKPSIVAVPHDEEVGDRSKAKLSELIVKQIFDINNYTSKQEAVDRWAAVFGEMYVSIEFDANVGDKKVSEGGKVKKDEKGKIERFGDVTLKLKEPFFVYPWPKRYWEDVHTIIEIEKLLHKEEAREKFGDIGDETGGTKLFEFTDLEDEKDSDEVILYRVIIKPHEFMPEGLVFRVINNKVVEEFDKYPFTAEDFPYERLTDIDAPARLHGTSFYQHLIPIQYEYNKMTSLLLQNLFLTAHPKIFMPEGSAKIESMGNMATVVRYSGPVAPDIRTFPASPPELYAFREGYREEMGQIGASHGVSRGEPPPGIRAGIALQFLEEQERELRSTAIRKKNEFIRRVAKKVIGTAGDYYRTDDERIIRIVGVNNQYELKSLKGSQLSGNYDFVIQNASALAESKTGKIAQMIELRNTFGPTFISDDLAAEVLEFGSIEKVYDIKTAARRSAEAENENMVQGIAVTPPTRWEELLTHYNTHMIFIQSRYFKQDVPEKFKQLFFDHIEQTEVFMEVVASQNPLFAQALQTLPGYPAFKTYSVLQTPLGQGAAQNTGSNGEPVPMEGIPQNVNDEGVPLGEDDLGGEASATPGADVGEPVIQ